jgi:hypothetical protein
MKFRTGIQGYATREAFFEADSLEEAKELIESGDASFEWGEVTDFDNFEFDEREAAFQLNDLELIESGDAS